MKIVIIEDDTKFVNEVKNKFVNFEVFSYVLQEEFHNANLDEIRDADYFLLDYYLDDNSNIVDAGIYKKILEVRKPGSCLVCISSIAKTLKNKMGECEYFVGKKLNILEKILITPSKTKVSKNCVTA